jgi:hypothetical protein
MLRKLIWIENPDFQGCGCSECAWTFKPSGRLSGDSLYERKEIYERRRDKEFAIHVCTEHKSQEGRAQKFPAVQT